MADELSNALAQGTGTVPPPAPADDPSGTGGGASANGAGPEPAGTPETDDLPGSLKEYLEKFPDHKAAIDLANAELKRGLTPRLQEAAELRKKLEGLDDQSLQSLRELQRMAQTDPAGAAAWLRQYADQIAPAQPQNLTQPPAPEYLTDGERALYQRVQDLESRLEKTSKGFETLSLQQQAQQVGDQFNKIGQELGIDIPLDVRRACFEQSQRVGGQLTPTEIYFARHRDAVVSRIAQKARDEAAGIVAGKAAAGAGNPNGVTPRTGADDGPGPTELKDILADE